MVLQNEYVKPFKAPSGQFFSLSLNLFGVFEGGEAGLGAPPLSMGHINFRQ
jgi:hypothetical protein